MMWIVFNKHHVGERKATAREALDAFFAAHPTVRKVNLVAGQPIGANRISNSDEPSYVDVTKRRAYEIAEGEAA